MLIVADCNMGNPGSILNMLKSIGVDATVSGGIDKIKEAERLILPGAERTGGAVQWEPKCPIVIRPSPKRIPTIGYAPDA